MNKTIFSCFVLFLISTNANAFSEYIATGGTNKADAEIFYSYESNHLDSYAGVGVGITLTGKENNIGVNLATSLSQANVLTTYGTQEDFLAWEGKLKLGYFSNFSLYGEFGFDIGELLVPDRGLDDIFFESLGFEPDREEREIDSYVGIGAGVKVGQLSLTAFSRIREINSEFWQAKNDVFHGIQVSISF